MNITEFKAFFKEKNKLLLEDEQIEVDVEEWVARHIWIDFLKEFTIVFWDYWFGYLTVDYNIWFITDEETVYINREFLEICIKNNFIWEKADKFYHFNLDINTEDISNDVLSYKDTVDLFIKNELWK